MKLDLAIKTTFENEKEETPKDLYLLDWLKNVCNESMVKNGVSPTSKINILVLAMALNNKIPARDG